MKQSGFMKRQQEMSSEYVLAGVNIGMQQAADAFAIRRKLLRDRAMQGDAVPAWRLMLAAEGLGAAERENRQWLNTSSAKPSEKCLKTHP